jgi:pyruvate kinase
MGEGEPAFHEELASVRDEIRALRDEALAAEERAAEQIAGVDPAHRAGALNLVRYLALRAQDLRPLQQRLSALGLSSLGRMESDVRGNLDAVLRVLDGAIRGESREERGGDELSGTANAPDAAAHDPVDALQELARNAARLLGGSPEDRSTRIMVTLPSSAADDAGLVTGFAEAGMDVARINCAHDDADAWRRMADHVRDARDGIPVAMDLGGPKLRTGPLPEGPHVVKVKPKRGPAGEVLSPARLRLTAPAATAPDEEDSAPVDDADWIAARTVDDTVRLTDARGRSRRLRVAEVADGSVLLEGERTTYLAEGATVSCEEEETTVGALPAVRGALRVFAGDTIVLTSALDPAETEPGRHRIGCTLPEALDAVEPGHRVAFDDGKIAGVVRSTREGEAVVEVTRASDGGSKLRAEKGINLPDTVLRINALTDEDREHLDTVVEVADIVELSFAQSAGDVEALLAELDERDADRLGVVVKLETVEGFRALPEILFALMRRRDAGVMIARGDLAVETGFERLAEVQEETLWLCEAAHLPVIWATQVLDDLAKRGVPTRAEVTDAAAANRAECVMLNKGPRIDDAIRALDDILRRMRGHMDKKRPLLRRLRSWSAEV